MNCKTLILLVVMALSSVSLNAENLTKGPWFDQYVSGDLVQAGVGGTDSWSQRARPYDPYRLMEKHYSYSFTIQPLK